MKELTARSPVMILSILKSKYFYIILGIIILFGIFQYVTNRINEAKIKSIESEVAVYKDSIKVLQSDIENYMAYKDLLLNELAELKKEQGQIKVKYITKIKEVDKLRSNEIDSLFNKSFIEVKELLNKYKEK